MPSTLIGRGEPVSSFSISLILSILYLLSFRLVVLFFPQLRPLLSYPFYGAARKPLEEWRKRPSGSEKCCLGNVLDSYDVGKKTLLGLLLSVRKKDRSYLQATLANGRRRAKIPREGTRQTSLQDASPILSPSFFLFSTQFSLFRSHSSRSTPFLSLLSQGKPPSDAYRRSYIDRRTI